MQRMVQRIHERASGSFVEYLNRQNELEEPLCELEKAAFKSTLPDYTETHFASLYLMRYSAAYLVEYYLAYKAVIESRFLKGNRLSIVSLGSGTALDGLAALKAIKELNPSLGCAWLGVDKVEWPFLCTAGDNLNSIRKNMDELEPADLAPLGQANIITLPKILSEIEGDVVTEFLDTMAPGRIPDRICLIVSNRNAQNKADRERDNIKMIHILKHITADLNYSVSHQHHIQGSDEKYRGKYLKDLPELPNPGNFLAPCIKNLADDPGQFCCKREDCAKRKTITTQEGYPTSKCRETIGRHPVIKTVYFDSHIYFLERTRCPF